jgi:UDP-glucose:(heptosyl)LPS alpha-1,3-glucosyltransferase
MTELMKLTLTFPGCHRRAGVERIMLESANYLARRGHDIRVCAEEFEYAALHPAITTQLIALPKIPFAGPLGLFEKAVREKLKGNEPELLCSFGTVCPTGGVLWVQSVHKAWLEISQSTRDSVGRARQLCNPIHPLLLRSERYHFGQRRYRKLIALTSQVSEDLQRLYRVPEGDICVLPNGFSPTDFNVQNIRERRSQIRAQLRYTDADKVIVFVANELERKGFGPLTEAIARLSDEKIKLLVVGRVDPQSQVKHLSALGLLARTKFIPQTNDVAKFLAAADVFALPTKYEAWGMVIVEALACGLPVVTSKLAGAAIAVQDGKTGLLVDDPCDAVQIASKLKEAIYELKTDPYLLAASVSKFEWDTILAEYESILTAECESTAKAIAAMGHRQ